MEMGTSTHLLFHTSADFTSFQNVVAEHMHIPQIHKHRVVWHLPPHSRPQVREWTPKWDIKIHIFKTKCIFTFQDIISVKGQLAFSNYQFSFLFLFWDTEKPFTLAFPKELLSWVTKKCKKKDWSNINSFIPT